MNRAGSVMNKLDFNWTMHFSDEQICVHLKKHFGMAKPVGEGFFHWVEAPRIKD